MGAKSCVKFQASKTSKHSRPQMFGCICILFICLLIALHRTNSASVVVRSYPRHGSIGSKCSKYILRSRLKSQSRTSYNKLHRQHQTWSSLCQVLSQSSSRLTKGLKPDAKTRSWSISNLNRLNPSSNIAY